MIERKKNVAGYVDERGVFRPIRIPKYVGTPKRRAKLADRKKYSRAKAGDLGKAKQERALEDVFQREIRLQREEREHMARVMKQIERETLGDATETTKGRTLVEFVRSQGGIRPGYKFGGKKNRGKRISYDAGELVSLTYKESGKRGLVSEKGKKSLDGMYQAAREAGYAVGDMYDLIALMEKEIRGGKSTYATHGYIDYRDNPSGSLSLSRYIEVRNAAHKAKGGKLTDAHWLSYYRWGNKAVKSQVIQDAAFELGMFKDEVKSWLDGSTRKTNGVLVGDRENKSDLYVTQLGPKSYGVFLKTYLLKKFTTKLGAMKHVQSIRSKAKKNPSAADPEKVIRRKFAQYLDIRGYQAMAKEVRAGADIRKTIKAVYGWEPPPFKKKLKVLEALLPKANPINIFGVVAAVSGVQSALQISEMLKKKPTKRKGRVAPKTNGKTTAIAKNPHDSMPSGARFNEKLFDQDLAQIEDGNFRLIRSANAHGRLAGYGKAEIDRLVQRARLAFQLKEMYKRKDNPAAMNVEVATLLAPLKTNGAFKRMLQRRKAANALKRELKLEAALEKTRAKKRKAISAATANPTPRKANSFVRIPSSKGRHTYNVDVFHGSNAFPTHGYLVKADTPAQARSRVKTQLRKEYSFLTAKGFADQFKAARYQVVRRNPARSAVGKKTVTRSANPKNLKSEIRNPKSVRPPRSRTFESFNGRPVTNGTQRPVSRHAPAKLAQLGDLIEIKLVGGQVLTPNPSRYKLTAANGRLWIAGGKFAKPNPAAKVNEINPLGEIDHVVYRTHKPHHGDAPNTHYIHKLGEETGHRPLLCVDKEGFPVIRGGKYKIEARGIVN